MCCAFCELEVVRPRKVVRKVNTPGGETPIFSDRATKVLYSTLKAIQIYGM